MRRSGSAEEASAPGIDLVCCLEERRIQLCSALGEDESPTLSRAAEEAPSPRRRLLWGAAGPSVESPLGEESELADARAFRALMHHIKETDPQHTVIMVQVENEIGLLSDRRDRSPLADAA